MLVAVEREERHLAAEEEFEKHKPERVDVRGVVAPVAEPALRGHVLHAAEAEHARLRDAGLRVEAGGAEIQHLHLSFDAHHDVGGLEVAMDDLERRGPAPNGTRKYAACRAEAASCDDPVRRPWREAAAPPVHLLDELCQVNAVDELHDDGGLTLDLGHGLDPQEVLVVQARQEPRLVPRADHHLVMLGPLILEDLDRDDAVDATTATRLCEVHAGEGA